MADVPETSSGIQELIDKLKDQGVNEGQRKAEQIIKEAQNKASLLTSQAKSDADRLLSEAYLKIDLERNSAHEAIKNAFRDAEIALRSKFREAFSSYLKRFVSLELKDKDFIKKLVLLIAGLKKPEIENANSIEVNLPSQIFEIEGGLANLSNEGKKQLQHLVLGLTNEMLREEVELKISSDIKGGIKVRLIGEDIEIDLTDEAISTLLLKYLLPRFREIVMGQE